MSRGMPARESSDDVLLATLPGLPALYGKALAAFAGRKLRKNRATAALPPLPAARHRVDGIRVDAHALTRWQHVIGAPGRDELPSAYVHTLGFPVAMSVLAHPDFPLPLLGMVHLSNEVHQRRTIGVSEVLDVVAWAEDLRPHAAGTQVDVVTEVCVAGEQVWTGRSVYLARGAKAGARAVSPSSRAERPPFAAPTPTGIWKLDAGIGRRYAGVSGDWNPIHLNGPAARALGMKSLIAHGVYLAARMVDDAVPAPQGALHWRIDFAAPVLLPATVTTSFVRAGSSHGGVVLGAGADGVRPDGVDAAGDGGSKVDVVGWSAKRQRVHFTGWVRAE